MSPVVVLVGPPGAGKSTVAELLGEAVGRPVRDTDADIEAAQGRGITDIFVDEGEPYFRALEIAAVREALAGHDGVLALGGGAVLHPDTRAALRGQVVVFLDVGLGEAASRVGLNSSRPLLLGNVRSQMKALLDGRRPLYREVATHVVRTDGTTPRQVADQIIEFLHSEGQGRRGSRPGGEHR